MRHAIIAAMIGFFVVSNLFADSVAPTTQPAHDIDQDEFTHPGMLLIARWNALLDDKSAASIEKLATSRPSASKVYQAMTLSTAALRNALAQARSRRGILTTAREVDFGKSQPGNKQLKIGRPFAVQLLMNKPKRVEFKTNFSDFDAFDPLDENTLHIVLNHSNLGVKLAEQQQQLDDQPQPGDQSIAYDGTLQPGQALVFLGKFTDSSGINYYHLVVWESFRAEGWQLPNIGNEGSGITTDWWIKYGPAKLRSLADIAAVWASRATHEADDPPAPYSVVLDNGAGLRLMGICEPGKFNFCWWDPAGDPIDAPMHLGLDSRNARTPFSYAIEVRGSTTEPDTPVPRPEGKNAAADWQLTVSGLRPSHRIEVTLGVGPWKQLGNLTQDQPLVADNVSYTVNVRPGDKWLQFVELDRSVASNDLMGLTAVTNDGKEIGTRWIDQSPTEADASFFAGAHADTVKTFHLWLRKSHVVTFADVALSPKSKPPESVTHDEAVEAAKSLYPDNPQ